MRLKNFFTSISAAVLSPLTPPKKLRNKRITLPSFVKSATPSSGKLPETDLQLANTVIPTYRTSTSTKETIRKLSKASPDLSSAVASALRLAITSDYNIVVRNMDSTINVEATRLAMQLASRFDRTSDYSLGFSSTYSIRSLSEILGLELLRYGSCSAELVLGKARLPEKIAPISSTQIKFTQGKGNKLTPVQVIGSEETELDVPTFFYVSLDQDILEPYSESPLQASIQPILGSQEFIDDLRRIFKRAIHPRIEVKIDEDKFRKTLPSEILYDDDKVKAYMSQAVADIASTVNGLEPEDALVYFDSLDIGYLTGGNTSLSDEHNVFNKILDGKLSAGSHSMPVVLGHEAAGSTNIASTQSMLFVKTVEGSVHEKLNEIYSRIFTLAVRLFGFDVTAEFRYNKIDLRPDSELEAFKAMKQSRVLEQLSLGFISDEEASLQLNGRLPQANMPQLSGTGFFKARDLSQNGYSNTNNQGALGETLTPATPAQPKGG